MYKTNEYMDTYWNWIFLFKLWFMLNTNLKHLFRTPDTSRRYFEYTGWFYYGRTCHPVYTFPRLSSSYKVSFYMLIKGSVSESDSHRYRLNLYPDSRQRWGRYSHLYSWRLEVTVYTVHSLIKDIFFLLNHRNCIFKISIVTQKVCFLRAQL